MGISKKEWGKVRGQPVALYTLGNIHGHLLKLSDLGATIIEIQVPDRAGVLADVNLGFATPVEYLKKTNPYFGAMVGRVANRINAGKFCLDGQEYTLACKTKE